MGKYEEEDVDRPSQTEVGKYEEEDVDRPSQTEELAGYLWDNYIE